MENDSINNDGRNAIARRILQVTDEDETIIPEFIDLNMPATCFRHGGRHER